KAFMTKMDLGVVKMTKEELEVEIEKLKSDYIRIQEDMDKLEFVGGRVSSAEGQLVELEKKIAHLKEKLQSQSEREAFAHQSPKSSCNNRLFYQVYPIGAGTIMEKATCLKSLFYIHNGITICSSHHKV